MAVNRILTDLHFSTDFRVRDQALESLTRRIKEASVNTRESLAPFAVTADPHQGAVIKSPARTIRMVAPAGAGKTQTIINRVLHRVQQGLNPARVLLLTFDNAAVNSIRIKLRERTGTLDTELSQLRISTLNAYGYSVLRDFFPPEYKRVIESPRQYALVRELRNELGRRSSREGQALPEYLAFRFYLEFFSFLKNSLFDPRALDPQAFTDFLLACPQAEVFFTCTSQQAVTRAIQAILWMYQGYERLLQRDGVLDFDDQKLRPYALLSKQPATLEELQGRWDEVIVDEFQDINHLDFVLVEAVGRKATLVVTGDDDQAIYGFRGCTPDYIIDLQQHLARSIESHELQINYRCPPLIVEHADRLIRHNVRRIPKNPRAASDAVAQIHVVSSLSAGLEAKSVVSLIQRVRTEAPALGYHDFVVLYRTNAQSLPLQVEFVLNDIPYYVRKDDNILQNEHLDKLLSILRLKLALNDGTTPSAWDAARTVCSFFRFVEPKVAARVEAHFRRGGNFLDTVRSADLDGLLPTPGRELLPLAILRLLAARTLPDALDAISERFRGLKSMIGGLDEVIEEKMPLGEINEIAASFGGGIKEFVSCLESALERARASNAGKDHKAGVPLLTYFRSKGLQWHTVILTTCNDGLIPHQRADVEEERRLFYVAMTRASSNLVLSHVQSVCSCKVQPSRFLYEAGLLEMPETGRKRKLAAVASTAHAVSPGGYVAGAMSKVFHRPECIWVSGMMDAQRVTYATRDGAMRAGKRPCRQCRP
ncbi:MAG: ATP-dependent helicase [Planctomycetes bacterium]|nr:ATP-dependent helicase [Planctomycetota bacterium]